MLLPPEKQLVDATQLSQRIAQLGHEITAHYQGSSLVLLGVLNGAFMFTADLCRTIDLEVEIDFIRVASYGDSTQSSGTIELLTEPRLDLTGKDILLVEDIVDTGTTLAWLKNYFQKGPAKSVRICSLIDKNERREVAVEVDYIGFSINQGFLVGYGLDCAEKYRNLDAIYTLT